MSTPVLALLFGLLGLVVSVVLNLCSDVLPPGLSGRGATRCPACGGTRPLYHLIPLLGYFGARGRCRGCGARMPLRPLLVELATGVLFALLLWRFGLGTPLGIYLLYVGVLIVIFVVEIEHQLVLDAISYPAMAAAFGLSWLLPGVGPLRSAVGGVFGMVTLALPFIVYRRRGMFGLGDVILGALLGLMVGWPVIALVLLASAVGAASVAVFLMAVRGRKRTDLIPFGPFLAATTVLALFWGQTVSDWVLSLIPG